MTVDKTYEIVDVKKGVLDNENYYRVIDDNNDISWYYGKRFVTIKQTRKAKLEEIYENNLHK